MVVVGDTLKVYGLLNMPVTGVDVEPSYQVRFQGAVPVNATDIVVDEPVQVVAEPLITDVGNGVTVSADVFVVEHPVEETASTTVNVPLVAPLGKSIVIALPEVELRFAPVPL